MHQAKAVHTGMLAELVFIYSRYMYVDDVVWLGIVIIYT